MSSPKMSIKNLRRHNAAYEKMDIIADLMKKDEECGEEVELRASGGTTRATRVTRSMVTVSPTASSCVSESTLMSVASASVAKGTPKKVGRRFFLKKLIMSLNSLWTRQPYLASNFEFHYFTNYT